ncbi:MAG: tetratricopeptide repeat protein [Planctomycetes bacterium]|nr:tetratricopeptide repeat protein [Planctomycetota bacterium]
MNPAPAPAPSPGPAPATPAPFRPGAARLRRLTPWALVACAALAAYSNTPENGFVHDDTVRVLENKLIRSLRTIPDLYRQRGLAPTLLQNPMDSVVDYRPLTATTYALDWAAWGGPEPAGFHRTNLLLHVLACWALLFLGDALFGNRRAAAAAALLFAVHPVHTEAVDAIANRSDLLCGGLIFLAVGAFARAGAAAGTGRRGAWLALSAAAFGAGLLAKEMAVVAPGLMLLVVAFEARGRPGESATRARAVGRRLAGLAPHLLVFVLYLSARLAVLGSVEMGPSLFDKGGVAGPARVRTMLIVLADYLRLVLWPAGLTAEYAVNSVGYPHPETWFAPAVLGAVAVLGGCAAAFLFLARRAPGGAFGLGWFWLALAPVSNLVFRIYVVQAERLLYVPDAGILLAAGLGWSGLVARAERPGVGRGARVAAWVALGAFACGLGVATWRRNPVWQDAESLYGDVLEKQPNSPRALEWMANVLGRRSPAAALALAAELAKYPGWEANALRVSAFAHYALGEDALAVAEFERFERLGASWKASLYHARALARLARPEEAERVFRRARELGPYDAEIVRSLGEHLVRIGKVPEGLQVLTGAAELEAGSRTDGAAIVVGLARGCRGAGREDLARAALDRGVGDFPQAASCWSERGRLRLETGDPGGAVGDFERALALAGDRPDALHGLTRALLRLGRNDEAEPLARRAAAAAAIDAALAADLAQAGIAVPRREREREQE